MKTRHYSLGIFLAVLSTTSLVRADVITEPTRTFTVNQDINDPQDPPQLFLETISDSTGFFYDGWNVTFSFNGAGGDVHLADTGDGTGILTGTYEADGRTLPTDTARPSLLDVFNGSTGNGDWRLAVGDLSPGGQMKLESWSLTLTGETAAPEPTSWALLCLGGLSWFAWRKQIKRQPKA